MIKWIGAHIWDFVSRFRGDVYLESVADHGSDPDRFLTMDSTTGKVSYRTGTEVLSDIGGSSTTGDMTGVDISVGTGLDITQSNTTSGDYSATVSLDLTEVINADSNYRVLMSDGDGTLTGNDGFTFLNDYLTLTSPSVNKPVFTLLNDHTGDTAPQVLFQKSDNTGADGDDLGEIVFKGDDDGGGLHIYANILGEIADATAGQEAGRLSLQVAEYDGTVTTGILIDGDTNADGEIDVTIGAGAASTTTIAGEVTLGVDLAVAHGGTGASTLADNSVLTGTGTSAITAESSLTYSAETLSIGNDDNGVASIQRSQRASTGDGGTLWVLGGTAKSGETNEAGGNLNLAGGKSTGSGAGGSVKVHTYPTGSSGTLINVSPSREWTFDEGGFFITDPTSFGTQEYIDFHTTDFEDALASGDPGSAKILKYSPGADDTLTDGQIYFLHTDGTWDQARADNVATGASQLLGIGNGTARGSGVILEGFIRIPSTEILNTPGSGAVDGLPVYVSTTAGHFDFTAPSGNNEFVRVVGYAIDDDSSDVLVYFNPDRTWVKVTA